jgi:glycosyltransferase involved in cell wall biosynthesis
MSELVSIVMATYNGQNYLRQQIQSILDQSYSNFELIVVDDGSEDETLSILKEFANRDDRIHFYPAVNHLGFVANFERGLMFVKGSFIALSDQDDIFRKDKIQIMVDTLKNSAFDMVISDLKLIDEHGVLISDSMWRAQNRSSSDNYTFKRIVHSNFATGCAMMFKKRLLKIAIPFPSNCLAHDWWLALTALSSNAGGVFLINETLTSYRQHSMNTIGAQKPSKISVFKNIKIFLNSNSNESQRCNVRRVGNNNHIKRLEGYLSLNIWSENDALILRKYLKLLEGYQADLSANLIMRIMNLPERLNYSILTKNLREAIQVLYFTFFPRR